MMRMPVALTGELMLKRWRMLGEVKPGCAPADRAMVPMEVHEPSGVVASGLATVVYWIV